MKKILFLSLIILQGISIHASTPPYVNKAPYLSKALAFDVQPDKKTVAAKANSSGNASLYRYNLDGSEDPSFGDNGIVHTNFNAHEINDLQIDQDGNIYLLGEDGRELANYNQMGHQK